MIEILHNLPDAAIAAVGVAGLLPAFLTTFLAIGKKYPIEDFEVTSFGDMKEPPSTILIDEVPDSNVIYIQSGATATCRIGGESFIIRDWRPRPDKPGRQGTNGNCSINSDNRRPLNATESESPKPFHSFPGALLKYTSMPRRLILDIASYLQPQQSLQ